MTAARLLYQDAAERERLLDLSRALRRPQLLAVAALVIPGALGMATYGWVAAVPLVVAAAVLALSTTPRVFLRAGAWAVLVPWAFGQAMALLTIALADGPIRYLLCLPAFVMALAAVSVGRRAANVGASLTMVGLVAVALLTAWDEVAACPPILFIPAALLFVITRIAIIARDLHRRTRDDAVVDELTGALNRVALQSHVSELGHLAEVAGHPVAIVIADVDHFKRVNDTHGHTTGDAVLRGVAERLCDAAGEHHVYRFGGEEFVVVLSGDASARAGALAEHLRAAVAAEPVGDLPVTVSCGVATTAPGDPFDYDELFRRADGALYVAKHAGRDQIRIAGQPDRARPAEGREPPRTALGAAPGDAAWAVRVTAGEHRSWLRADAMQRAHLLDMAAGAASYGRAGALLLIAPALVAIPWLGWQWLLPGLISGTATDAFLRSAARLRRPEVPGFACELLALLMGGLSILIVGEQGLFALPLLAFSLVGSTTGLPPRANGALAATGVAVIVASGVAVDPGLVAADPFVVAFPAGLLVSFVILGTGLGRAVRTHRMAAVSDRLTGTLNRAALEARIPELREVVASGRDVSLLVADLDHFKAVNDRHGHDVGDRVLAEVAYRMRSQLRHVDSIYRIGGEEFVVLLDGADAATATAAAERVRSALAATPVAGIPVTISVGVATTRGGGIFDYDALFADADAALLAAKRAGRDRVVRAGAAPAPAAIAG